MAAAALAAAAAAAATMYHYALPYQYYSKFFMTHKLVNSVKLGKDFTTIYSYYFYMKLFILISRPP